MKTGRLGRYVCKARQGDAMRGKAQLPASSMQLTVAVTVTVTATGASGANVATVTGPDGQPGDGLSKAWLWWIGKGVTGWRRTIADAAFANTKSCRKGLDGTARRTERQTEGWGEATVEVGNQNPISRSSTQSVLVLSLCSVSSCKSGASSLDGGGGCRGPVHLIVLSEPANGTRASARGRMTHASRLFVGLSSFSPAQPLLVVD